VAGTKVGSFGRFRGASLAGVAGVGAGAGVAEVKVGSFGSGGGARFAGVGAGVAGALGVAGAGAGAAAESGEGGQKWVRLVVEVCFGGGGCF